MRTLLRRNPLKAETVSKKGGGDRATDQDRTSSPRRRYVSMIESPSLVPSDELGSAEKGGLAFLIVLDISFEPSRGLFSTTLHTPAHVAFEL